RRVLGARLAAARVQRGGPPAVHLADRAARRLAGTRRRAAPADVPSRRLTRRARAGARPSRWVPLVEAGTHRKRRRAATPARHLWRTDRRDLDGISARRPGGYPRLDAVARARRLALGALGSARRGHLGDAEGTQELRLRPRYVVGRARSCGPA